MVEEMKAQADTIRNEIKAEIKNAYRLNSASHNILKKSVLLDE